MEIWKDIKGYEGVYQISTNGRVKSLSRYVKCRGGLRRKKAKILKSQIRSNGYLMVTICKDWNTQHLCIHRLLAETFILNPKGKPQVNHKDGDKSNNSILNLEWATPQENIIHAFKNHLIPSGERHSKAKLNNKQVNEIRNSELKQYELVVMYGVSPATISNIVNNKSWRFT